MPLRERRVSNQAGFRVASGAGGSGLTTEDTGDTEGEETAFHFPSGQASVAMRSLAHVEHPHFLQRPVPFSAPASHSGQARHVASRVARISGGVVAKPARAKRVTALATDCACSVFLEKNVGGSIMVLPELVGIRYRNHRTAR